MLLFKSRRVALGTLLLLTILPGHAADPVKSAPPDMSTAAATVNGTPISEYRLNKLARDRAAKGQPDTAESRKKLLDQLVMQLILSQEARRLGLDKSPELQDYIDLTMQSILATAFVQNFQRTNPIGEDLLKAEYEKFRTRAAGQEYKARHILVASEAEATDLIAKLKTNPEEFEALAKANSKDPGSKAKGGDLGWFDPSVMVPEFGAAVTALAKGKFTESPVKSQFGYHVIMLDDARPKPIPTIEEVSPKLQRELQEQRLQKLTEELKAKAKIKLLTPPPAATAPADKGAAAPAGK